MPSRASVATWNATSSRLCRFTIACPAGAASISSTAASMSRVKRVAGEALGVRADAAGVPACVPRRARRPSRQRLDGRLVDEQPGLAVDRRCRARRRGRARPPAGRRPAPRPARSRSLLRPGRSVAIDVRYSVADSSSSTPAEQARTPAVRQRLEAGASGPSPTTVERARPPRGRRRWRGRRVCRAPSADTIRNAAGLRRAGRRRPGVVELGIDRWIHNGRLADYSTARSSAQHIEK